MPQTRLSDETRARCERLWPDICDSLADGLDVRDVLAMASVSKNVARQYMVDNPDARKAWDDAKRDSADAYFAEVRNIAYNPGPDPQRARLQADMFRWLAGKRNPRDYSDKSTVDLNVRTIDLTDAVQRAQLRYEAQRAIEGIVTRKVIEGIVTRKVIEGARGGTGETDDGGHEGGGGTNDAVTPESRVVPSTGE